MNHLVTLWLSLKSFFVYESEQSRFPAKTVEDKEREVQASSRQRGKDVFEKWGVPRYNPTDATTTHMTLAEMGSSPEHKVTFELLEPSVGVYELAEIKGVTGTKIHGGHIQVDPNPQKRPYILRGALSSPGEYEEAYLESNAFRGVNETRNLLVSSHWSVSAPPVEDEDNPSPEEIEHRNHAEWLNDKLNDVKVGDQQRGIHDLIESVSSMLIQGFSIHEIVWATDSNGWKYPAQILFREQSTVWEWVIDQEEDLLAAVNFRTGDQNAASYSLKAGGPNLEDQEMLLTSMNRRGKNYEGISPLRPSLYWIKLKILLSRISAAAADLQGIPVRYVRNALEVLKEDGGTPASDMSLDDVLDALLMVEKGEDTIVKLPNGVEVGVLDREGALIDVTPMIDYADRQITMPLSTEGSLLGHGQVGSYAMASVSDTQFLSQIPYVKKQIASPLNDLIRRITIANIGPQDTYAQMEMRFDVARDNSKFFADLVTLMNSYVWTWPEQMQEIILEEMGLPLNLFDQWDPQDFVSGLTAAPPDTGGSAFSEVETVAGKVSGLGSSPILDFYRAKMDSTTN